MYNRYVPQPDGTYRCNRVGHPPPAPPGEPDRPFREPDCPPPPPPKKEPIPGHRPGFLQQLLPKDFDTGDLIVILLLLLMAGDCPEDRNNAIMTIALYFLM